MRSVAPITKIVPLFLWGAKMPKIYAKCQKFMQKLWNFIFCHLNIVRAVYKLSFKLLVRSVAQITKIVPPFLWFRGGLCYKHRGIRHGDWYSNFLFISLLSIILVCYLVHVCLCSAAHRTGTGLKCLSKYDAIKLPPPTSTLNDDTVGKEGWGGENVS